MRNSAQATMTNHGLREPGESAGDFGIVGHIGAVLGLAFSVFVIAVFETALQLPLLATLLIATAIGSRLRVRKGLNNALLATGLTLTVVFLEPFVFWGGPIFFASLVLFPLGIALIGLVVGARLRWALERFAGLEERRA